MRSQLKPHLGELIIDCFKDFKTVLCIVINRAKRLGALPVVEILDRRAHFVVIEAARGELERMKRLRHGARASQWKEIRHARGKLLLKHRVVGWRPDGEQHGENLVPVNQLVGRLDGARHLIAGVLHDHSNRATVHAAGGIRLIDSHAHAVDCADAPDGDHAGKVGVRAEHDLVV